MKKQLLLYNYNFCSFINFMKKIKNSFGCIYILFNYIYFIFCIYIPFYLSLFKVIIK